MKKQPDFAMKVQNQPKYFKWPQMETRMRNSLFVGCNWWKCMMNKAATAVSVSGASGSSLPTSQADQQQQQKAHAEAWAAYYNSIGQPQQVKIFLIFVVFYFILFYLFIFKMFCFLCFVFSIQKKGCCDFTRTSIRSMNINFRWIKQLSPSLFLSQPFSSKSFIIQNHSINLLSPPFFFKLIILFLCFFFIFKIS